MPTRNEDFLIKIASNLPRYKIMNSNHSLNNYGIKSEHVFDWVCDLTCGLDYFFRKHKQIMQTYQLL